VSHRIDQSLEPLLRRAAPLSEFAWKSRYPGDPGEATTEQAIAALATAPKVFNPLLDGLPGNLRPQPGVLASPGRAGTKIGPNPPPALATLYSGRSTCRWHVPAGKTVRYKHG
jgi:hypothetical protein